MDGDEKCAVRFCTGRPVLTYCGHRICERHSIVAINMVQGRVTQDHIEDQLNKGYLRPSQVQALQSQEPRTQEEIFPMAKNTKTPAKATKSAKKAAEPALKKGDRTRAGAEVLGTELNENGKVHKVTIRCTVPGCKNTRRIKIQDAFQVKFCDAHRTASSRNGSQTGGKKADKKAPAKKAPAADTEDALAGE